MLRCAVAVISSFRSQLSWFRAMPCLAMLACDAFNALKGIMLCCAAAAVDNFSSTPEGDRAARLLCPLLCWYVPIESHSKTQFSQQAVVRLVQAAPTIPSCKFISLDLRA